MITAMITRDEQVRALAAGAGISYKQAQDALDGVAALVVAGLIEDGRFMYHRLGTFMVTKRKLVGALAGKPDATTVKFTPTSKLRRSVEDKHS